MGKLTKKVNPPLDSKKAELLERQREIEEKDMEWRARTLRNKYLSTEEPELRQDLRSEAYHCDMPRDTSA